MFEPPRCRRWPLSWEGRSIRRADDERPGRGHGPGSRWASTATVPVAHPAHLGTLERLEPGADNGLIRASPRGIATNPGPGDVIIAVKGSSHSTDVQDADNVRLVGRPMAMSHGNDRKTPSPELQGACHRCGWRGMVSKLSGPDRKTLGTGRAYGRLCPECIDELRTGRPPRQDTGARRQTDGGDSRSG
jgi:hypothetical protein